MTQAHTHLCERCNTPERCIAPWKCIENGTTGVKVLCEKCARAKVAESQKQRKDRF